MYKRVLPTYIYMHHMGRDPGAHGSQKKAPDPLELQYEPPCDCWQQNLGTRQEQVLLARATSPALLCFLK